MRDRGQWQLSDLQRLLLGLAVVTAVFLSAMSLGMGSIGLLLVALLMLVVAGLAVFLLGLYYAGKRSIQGGTAYVIMASAPPVGSIVGRCDMRLLLDLPGGGTKMIKLRDPSVSVTKWPRPGSVLEIEVDQRNPRNLRVRWEKVTPNQPRPPDDAFADVTPFHTDYAGVTPALTPALTTAADPYAGPTPPMDSVLVDAIEPLAPDRLYVDIDDYLDEPEGADVDRADVPVLGPLDPAGPDPLAVPELDLGDPSVPSPRAPVDNAPRDRGPVDRAGLDPVELSDLEPVHDVDMGFDTDQGILDAAELGRFDSDSVSDVTQVSGAAQVSDAVQVSDAQEAPEAQEARDAGHAVGGEHERDAEQVVDAEQVFHSEQVFDAGQALDAEQVFHRDEVFDVEAFDREAFDREAFDEDRAGEAEELPAPRTPGDGDERARAAEYELPLRGIPQPRPAEPLATEPLATEPRPAEPRPAEPRPTEPRPVEPRPAEPTRRPSSDPSIDEAATAARPATANGSPTPAGMGIMLLVSDLRRSLDFYRDTLAFNVVDSTPATAVLAYGAGRILLRHQADMSPVDRRVIHLHIEVSDVDVAYQELLDKGVEFVHKPRVLSRGDKLELWAARFRDPDGHGIALTQWRDRHEAPRQT